MHFISNSNKPSGTSNFRILHDPTFFPPVASPLFPAEPLVVFRHGGAKDAHIYLKIFER